MRLRGKCSIAYYHYNMTYYRLCYVMKHFNIFLVNEVNNIMLLVMLQFRFLVDLEDACSDVKCFNGGTCEIIDEKTFKCACLEGYTGKNCEKQSKW